MSAGDGKGVFGFGASDSEDELPPGWEERTTLDGRVYYANFSHGERTTQWTHPRTSKKKRLVGDLPPGWERETSPDGKVIFVNHKDRRTTYTDPRLAFAIEEKEGGGGGGSGAPRQKYDACTRGIQILHGMDLSNTTVLITGANSGIGFETARCLALHKAHVVMACRNLKNGQIAAQKILAEKDSAKIDVLECDLSSLSSVRLFCQTFKSRGWSLHILILNAAVFGIPFGLTLDSHLELNFAVNHVGHFYLTYLLQDVLIDSAPARVVVVSSESHRQAPAFQNLGSPQDITLERLSPDRPGNMIATGLPRHSCFMRVLFTLVRPFTKSAEQGAATTLFCAVAPELSGIGGHYFNNCWFCDPNPITKTPQLQSQLWEVTQSIVDQFENRFSQ